MPVTVYVVVEVGLIVFVAPAPKVPHLSNVVTVISGLAISSVLAPRQISNGIAVDEIVVKG